MKVYVVCIGERYHNYYIHEAYDSYLKARIEVCRLMWNSDTFSASGTIWRPGFTESTWWGYGSFDNNRFERGYDYLTIFSIDVL